MTSILLILNLSRGSQIQSQQLERKQQQLPQHQDQQQLQQKQQQPYHSEYTKFTLIISGIFSALLYSPKYQAFTIIPLGMVMTYIVTRKKKYVILWLIPVLLVPLLWPIHATLSGDMNDWIDGVRYQVNRDRPLINTLNTFFQVDPVLFILGLGGLVYSAIKRDYFVLLWAIPIIIPPGNRLCLFIPYFAVAASILYSRRYYD